MIQVDVYDTNQYIFALISAHSVLYPILTSLKIEGDWLVGSALGAS